MQPTYTLRRRPLASLIVGLAAALCAAPAVEASPFTGDIISVFHFGSATTVNDLAGTATTSGYSGRGELLLANDGNFYVAQSVGGSSGAGAIMRITPDGTAVVVHSLAGATSEGAVPYSGLIQATDGNLYGTSYAGGEKSLGTVYRVGLDGTYATVFSFHNDSQLPYQPYAALVQGPDGALYGTSLRGGQQNLGTLFRLTLDGTLTTLVSFNGTNGSNPEGQLIVGADGALYGTTMTGGDNDRGTIYKVLLSGTTGTQTVLYSFPTMATFDANGNGINTIGANPRAGLRLGADGNFYGTAYQGGASGYGTVYRMTPAGVVTVLHTFGGAPTDGARPLAPVTVMADGTLYGTTSSGGGGSGGVAWRIAADGTWSLLHSFTNPSLSILIATTGTYDGSVPYVGLVPYNGYLYGMTYTDNYVSAGSMFKIDQGSGGVLPVSLAVSPETITLGQSATLTWSSPTAASCLASQAWTDTISTSGSQTLTPTSAGIYTYDITCTDNDSTIRTTRAVLTVESPPAQSVDGGASTSGGGDMGPLALLLLAAAALACVRHRLREPAP